MAFAAIHFNDQYFLKSLKELFSDTGLDQKLSGLLLTGLSHHKNTHDLLSRYVF